MASWCIDHEAGDLSEYDSTVTDGGDLSAHADAAYEGSYGLRAVIDDTNTLYANKTFDGKSRLRVGFYFDPNGLTMDASDEFLICADSAASVAVAVSVDACVGACVGASVGAGEGVQVLVTAGLAVSVGVTVVGSVAVGFDVTAVGSGGGVEEGTKTIAVAPPS